MPILVKLLIAFGMVLAMCTVISSFSLWQLYTLGQNLDLATDGTMLLQQRDHLISGVSWSFWALICSLGAGGLGVMLASFFIKRAVVRPIEIARDAAIRIAGRDLSGHIAINSTDETGLLLSALASMQQSLTVSLSEVRQVTDGIHTASSDIAAGAMDLAARTEHAAASLEQTSATLQSLTDAVHANERSATEASELAALASIVVDTGSVTVNQAVLTMGDIQSASKRVAEIIGVIDGIAFQTNILALNAAVEAARAGEQGRGFAVVAGEVRSLAQRSAGAAGEIRGLIFSSVEKIDVGSKQVAVAGTTMGEILSAVSRVAEIVGEINSASSDQATGISELEQAVRHVDQMTQQNASMVEQSAAAAVSLREQASQLAGIVGTFRLKC